MAVGVVLIDEAVVVLPGLVAGVVRWIDVDAVHLSGVGPPQHLQGVEVLPVDDDMCGLASLAPPHLAHRGQAGEDLLVEPLHDQQVRNGDPGLGPVGALGHDRGLAVLDLHDPELRQVVRCCPVLNHQPLPDRSP